MLSTHDTFGAAAAVLGGKLTLQGGRLLADEVRVIAHRYGLSDAEQSDLRLFLEACCGCVVEGDWYMQPAVARCEGQPNVFRRGESL